MTACSTLQTLDSGKNTMYVEETRCLSETYKNVFYSSDVKMEHSLNLPMFLSQFLCPAMGQYTCPSYLQFLSAGQTK